MSESFAERADATTLEQLRAAGGTKWLDPEIIGAFVAEMDFGVAPVISEALHEFVDAGAFGYAPRRYVEALTRATAERLRNRQGWDITPEQVIPVPDVIRAFEVALDEFTPPGAKVIVPTPSYMPFLRVPGLRGREVIEVPMLREQGTWRFDLAAIDRAFAAGGGCLVLCNPYNPLGRVFGRDELLELCEVVDRNGGRVFSDEIWAPLVFGDGLVSYATLSDTAAGHTITATSASKAWNLPGLKCAELVVSNRADLARITELGPWVGHGTATPGMVATVAAFERGEPWLADALDYLRGSRDELVELVAEHLPGVRFIAPEATYVAWLDFSELGIERPGDFFREHAGVALTEGADCGEAGRGCARFIFAMPRPIMREAIARMGRALAARES